MDSRLPSGRAQGSAKPTRWSSRKGPLAAPHLVAAVLMIVSACGDETTPPTPAVSLAVVPSTVTFSVVTRPTPECCFILSAQWTLMVDATASGDLESVTITLRDPVTGYVYVDRRSERKQLGTQAPTHLEAGVPVAIPQALLETMPPEFQPAERLRLRVEVVFKGGGQTVTEAIEPPFVAAF